MLPVAWLVNNYVYLIINNYRPSQCRLKFPITKKPIHLCEVPKHEYTLVPQVGGWRTLLVPKTTPNYYPAVMNKDDYERLKKQARVSSFFHAPG